jgi:hypothetical protein
VKKYEVWMEGYSATGDRGYASLLGVFEAPTFKEACDIAIATTMSEQQYYDRERGTYWACRLFDNEADARRAFG